MKRGGKEKLTGSARSRVASRGAISELNESPRSSPNPPLPFTDHLKRDGIVPGRQKIEDTHRRVEWGEKERIDRWTGIMVFLFWRGACECCVRVSEREGSTARKETTPGGWARGWRAGGRVGRGREGMRDGDGIGPGTLQRSATLSWTFLRTEIISLSRGTNHPRRFPVLHRAPKGGAPFSPLHPAVTVASAALYIGRYLSVCKFLRVLPVYCKVRPDIYIYIYICIYIYMYAIYACIVHMYICIAYNGVSGIRHLNSRSWRVRDVHVARERTTPGREDGAGRPREKLDRTRNHGVATSTPFLPPLSRENRASPSSIRRARSGYYLSTSIRAQENRISLRRLPNEQRNANPFNALKQSPPRICRNRFVSFWLANAIAAVLFSTNTRRPMHSFFRSRSTTGSDADWV